MLLRTPPLVLLAGLLPIALIACRTGTPVASASASGPAPATATTDSLVRQAKTLIREAADKGSIDSLKQARAVAERATNGSENRALAHYYVGLADFRMINQIPEDDEDRREQVIEDAIGHLKRATEVDETMADAWALLSGCYGRMMDMTPTRGMSLGPKSNEAMETAQERGPDNPRVWIIDGTSDFYTPSMFGGDKEQALKKFRKAARLAEQESIDDPLMPSWGRAEAHAWIGLAHMDAERYDQARTAFETALDVNPDYGWVREVLLPRLEKQTG